jgi:hypothetical protein
MSASPPKADIDHDGGDVCFVLKATFRSAVIIGFISVDLNAVVGVAAWVSYASGIERS